MKKFFSLIVIFISLNLCANANSVAALPYPNLNNNARIFYNPDIALWNKSNPKPSDNVLYKRINKDIPQCSEFYDKSGNLIFSLNSDYEFIKNNRLIAYSNNDLNFYDITILNGDIIQNPLSVTEVQELFPQYRILKLSDFSTKTNSVKIKKRGKVLKLLIFNDINANFTSPEFFSNNAKISTNKSIKGLAEIHSKGMIQFSSGLRNFGWYVIMVR